MAIKLIDRKSARSDVLDAFEQESSILQSLSGHPNILELIETFTVDRCVIDGIWSALDVCVGSCVCDCMCECSSTCERERFCVYMIHGSSCALLCVVPDDTRMRGNYTDLRFEFSKNGVSRTHIHTCHHSLWSFAYGCPTAGIASAQSC